MARRACFLFLMIVSVGSFRADEADLRIFQWARQGDKGVVCAPAALSDMLGLLYQGSAGETEQQLRDLLFTGLSREQRRELVAGIPQVFPGYRNLAGLWVTENLPLLDDFRQTARKDWGFAIQNTLVPGQAETSRQRINEWFGRETQGRFPQVIAPGQLDGREVLVAVGLAAFVGHWDHFQAKDTIGEFFHHSSESKTRVAMMKSQTQFDYHRAHDFHVVRLTHRNSELVFLLWVPLDPRRFQESLDALTHADWVAAMEGFARKDILLWMPIVESTSRTNWVPGLRAQGLELPFSMTRADLSRISDNRPDRLFVSSLNQTTWVRWNEKGVEAWAATMMGVEPFGEPPEPPPPLPVIANHPFAFMICHPTHRRIHFAGIISEAEQLKR